MREPAFWHQKNSRLSAALGPVASIYGRIAAKRMLQDGARVGVPVICVGNFHAGGAGKTPTVLAIVSMLRASGERPVILSRGYGGSEQGPTLVSATEHIATQVGDEPLMMAQTCPVVIARDRAAGARLAEQQGATVIVMDDGFQNPAIAKDFSLIVVDSHRALGNLRVIPAGPLRAPLDVQMPRADALMVIGNGNAADELAEQFRASNRPVFTATVMPTADALAPLKDVPVLAFAGIGDPPKFLRTLRENGISVQATAWFPDHHAYNAGEIASLKKRAALDQLTLVTTEKDYIRIRNLPDAADIVPVPITLSADDPDAFASCIHERLKAARDDSKR